ncbi:MAG: YegP family protein [Thermoanaerobaculia bacterium]|nr:YegP family protein [Thermoanaerobaculia bacterium]
MAGKYRVYEGSGGKTYFQLKAPNGQVILQSQGYAKKASAMNGIESVRKNSKDDSSFDRKQAKNGEHYFVLKAKNGQVIAQSETYKKPASMENGIASVKKNANAAVSDETA